MSREDEVVDQLETQQLRPIPEAAGKSDVVR